MVKTLEEALGTMKIVTSERRFRVVGLPSGAVVAAAGLLAEARDPFAALVADPKEVSLIVDAETWEREGSRLPGAIADSRLYALLTFDVVMDLSLIGFMARISGALAAAGVPVYALAAYSTDHVLVPEDKLAAAQAALDALISVR